MENARRKVFSLRFMLAGLVLPIIGLSQAASGWMGDGALKRIGYPILCCVMAVVCLILGRQMLADAGARDSQPLAEHD